MPQSACGVHNCAVTWPRGVTKVGQPTRSFGELRLARLYGLVLTLTATLTLTACSSPSNGGADGGLGRDSTPSDSSTTSTAVTTTTIDSIEAAAIARRETLMKTAEEAVASWTEVIAASAKLVKLPPKTSPGGQPVIYDNGCHLGWSTIKPRLCEFGDLTSDVTVVITGDSHAAHWFGAFEEAAKTWGWRLVSVTKRGCPAADVRVNKSTEDGTRTEPTPYVACDKWRVASQEFIRALKPDVVVFPMLTRRGVIGSSGEGTATAWREGLVRSIAAITKGTNTKALVMSNTPKTIGSSIPQCLWNHAGNIKPCENKTSVAALPKYVENLKEAARVAGAGFVDVTPWMCTTTLCPAVVYAPTVKPTMVYRDSHHLSDKFSRLLANHVALAVDALLAPR